MLSARHMRAPYGTLFRILVVTAIAATLLLAAPLANPTGVHADEDPPDFLLTLGTRGGDPGQFEYPDDVAIGRDGLIYVADESNYRVQVVDAAGNSVRAPWGDGMFGYPTGVAVDINGTVHVCDADDSYERITAHNPFTGTIDYSWGNSAEFSGPQGIAATSVGGDVYIYVADTYNDRIRKFSYDPSSGYAHVVSWDGSGTEAGQMWDPRGVAVAPDGSIYVTDTNNGRVIQFTASGDYINQWGTRVPGGTELGEFWDPEGIAVDAEGNVYVVDTGNHRIQMFAPDGTGLCVWSTGDGSFSYPGGVAVDRYGIIYLADSGNHRIQVFGYSDVPPAFLAKYGIEGTDDGQFGQNRDVAVDPDGNVYVADTSNNRIQRFTPTGASGAYEHDETWGGPAEGSGVGEFSWPEGLCADGEGNVYVADTSNYRVQKYDGTAWTVVAGSGSFGGSTPPDGEFYQLLDVAVAADGTLYTGEENRIQAFSFDPDTGQYTFSHKWGSGGSGDGQFDRPSGIALDAYGYVYVSDFGRHRVQKFDSDGNFICKWGSEGTGEGQFKCPRGVAIDSEGYLYVVEYMGHRVQKFTGNGIYLTQWGTQGSGDGQFSGPFGLAVDSEDNVFVADTQNHRVQVFGESATQELTIDLKAGWNMVSVPVVADDMSTGAVFPGVDAVYTWNPNGKSYTVPTTIEPEKGYWVAVSGDKTITVTGEPVTDWTDEVLTGWNMIGSVHGASVDFADPDDSPDSSVEGFLYSWDPTTKSYSYGTMVEQGKGYWVACTDTCDLTIGPPPA